MSGDTQPTMAFPKWGFLIPLPALSIGAKRQINRYTCRLIFAATPIPSTKMANSIGTFSVCSAPRRYPLYGRGALHRYSIHMSSKNWSQARRNQQRHQKLLDTLSDPIRIGIPSGATLPAVAGEPRDLSQVTNGGLIEE